ncbi:MAG: glycosyltransferase family 2 protein [Usitatibacter sp.]
MPETLDIVVPVYRGEAETRACLQSVFASANRRPIEVVVINDASPEPAISAWLEHLATEGKITLITHPVNLGFVAGVNAGMALHPTRDVILLNSDTEVGPGWVDRIGAHFGRDATIGTLTPFSNNATICSYPKMLAANAIPLGETAATLDAACAAANAGRTVDVPTGVGFCMAISRKCLDRVGPFDLERYGAGYGEEVDFCMRAARAGFRNVLAGDVFVRHVGEISFGGSGADRRARAQAMVDSLYPEFQQQLATFIPADPPRMMRRRVDLQRLRGHRHALVMAQENGYTRLTWPHPGEDFVLWLETARDARKLSGLLSWLDSSGEPMPEIEPRWLAAPTGPPSPMGLAERLRRLF